MDLSFDHPASPSTSASLAFPPLPPTGSATDSSTSSPLRKRRRCGTVDRDVKALLDQSASSQFSDDDTDSALALHSRSASRNSPQVHLSSSAPSSYASSKRRVYGPLPPLSFDVSSIPPYCPKRTVYSWLNKPTRHVDPPSEFGCLHPGAVFRGSQRSGANEYTVQVRLVNLDLPRSHLSAFLDINGLTAVQPDITTYLEAEIIGPHHSFLTKRWEADESVDREHWRKFPEFRNEVGDLFKQDGYVYDSRATDIVFMRWKELFLVPDHSQTSIDGASFSGFYYIACNVRSGAIVGYYYSGQQRMVPAPGFGLRARARDSVV
ncbi:vacuolar import and degradation protein-domain-containing protein [Catenaria anguillulae PL171]|uniref:Vacuolar import and degradation protein-domain-containing protein n=1 Tax=Catenaria anguillulae PL171 TaxID=765915 RepID=A0A1Y2HEP3_9FUNG|nr:vacuolar import and degradation protein-domain-containing protein [Catenaria anguillulae PL171]